MVDIHFDETRTIIIVMSLMLFVSITAINTYETYLSDTIPKIELRRGIGYNGETYVLGRYETYKNKITIYTDTYDIESTILHEYCHYIYNRIMTHKEKKTWETLIGNHTIQGYSESNQATEHFARACEDVRKGIYNKNLEYTNIMMEKYIE